MVSFTSLAIALAVIAVALGFSLGYIAATGSAQAQAAPMWMQMFPGMHGFMQNYHMWGSVQESSDEERISIRRALEIAEDYASSLGEGYGVLEVMEFTNNFYAVIVEKETGMGAMEILIDPYSGYVMPEPGPNMMWNAKYGMHVIAGSDVAEMRI